MKLLRILIITFGIFIIFSFPLQAQTEKQIDQFNALVDALNNDTDLIYTDYVNFFDNFDVESSFVWDDFTDKNRYWKSQFTKSLTVYEKYAVSSDPKVAEVAQLAVKGAQQGITAIEKYQQALESDSDSSFQRFLTEGDDAITLSVTYHDQAVTKNNEYSGANSSVIWMYILFGLSIVSGIITLFIFTKTRIKVTNDYERKLIVFRKSLMKSSLWFFLGVLVTAVTLAFAMRSGGTYYILYGPILWGGYMFLAGIIKYFTKGKAELQQLQNNPTQTVVNALPESPLNPPVFNNTSSQIRRCRNCNTVVGLAEQNCPKCGYKLLV